MTVESRPSRLSELFTGEGCVFLPYLTAGLPNGKTSPDLFSALADAGADGFEVGIPYSDPLMDGPVIQRAGQLALQAGTTIDLALGIIETVTIRTGLPAIVMTYVNPLLQRGVEWSLESFASAGASGLIVPDLPIEEITPFREAADAIGLGLVAFVAPTTDDDRLGEVVAQRPAFIYGVADMGVTGNRETSSEHASLLAERVHKAGDVPLVLGVGISTPDQAAEAAKHAEGVIVGSALVATVLDGGSDVVARLSDHARQFATAVHHWPIS
ncbi:MAG: tryptophan synthase subunit alpha [Acidimicrobiia bacterium]|nr:tryptophan synthase subunit alpha [Acidimicrobiia bacterium]